MVVDEDLAVLIGPAEHDCTTLRDSDKLAQPSGLQVLTIG